VGSLNFGPNKAHGALIHSTGTDDSPSWGGLGLVRIARQLGSERVILLNSP
jgi:hypothetical protein